MAEPTRRIGAFTLAALAVTVAAIVGTGGCSHTTAAVPGMGASPTASPSPTPSGSPTPSPSPTPTANVYVSMQYASMPPTMDPVYGEVDGYAQVSPPPTPSPTPSGSPSPTPTPSPSPSPSPTPSPSGSPSPFPSPSPSPGYTPGPSSIIHVACNQNIQFENFDVTAFHSAALLNPPGVGFPAVFNNANGTTPSVLLTPISLLNFNSGLVGAAAGHPGLSLVYNTGSVSGTYYIGDWTNYNSTPSMRTVIIVTGCARTRFHHAGPAIKRPVHASPVPLRTIPPARPPVPGRPPR